MTETAPHRRAMNDIETVAIALFIADPLGPIVMASAEDWPELSDEYRGDYRRMAQAAIEALSLTEETTCPAPAYETKRDSGGVGVLSYAGQTSRYLGMRTYRRLVSPWQQVSTEPAAPPQPDDCDDDEYALRNAAG